jgi:hypothetical protein
MRKFPPIAAVRLSSAFLAEVIVQYEMIEPAETSPSALQSEGARVVVVYFTLAADSLSPAQELTRVQRVSRAISEDERFFIAGGNSDGALKVSVVVQGAARADKVGWAAGRVTGAREGADAGRRRVKGIVQRRAVSCMR